MPKVNKQGQMVKADIETMSLYDAAKRVVDKWRYLLIREHKENKEGEARKYEVKNNEGNRSNRWTVLDSTTSGVMVQVVDYLRKIANDETNERKDKAIKLLEHWEKLPLSKAIDFVWKFGGK